ncbi:MAG: Jag N-terminal domain-containing protein [Desulfamplus sp.]|nr:Jag N-terminal domain-containing protein [Desulfamplus sp.]
MKKTQEFDGKNVDNAVDKACMALNIAKKNLVYDVISSGSTGIFGIVGVKKAKIRVTLPENSRVDGASSSYDSDRAGVMSIVDEAFGKDINKSPVDAPILSDNSQDSDSNRESIPNNSIKDRPLHPKSRKPKPSGKKTSIRREESEEGTISTEQPLQSLSDENVDENIIVASNAEPERVVAKKHGRSKPVAARQPQSTKPYSRKSRPRKKDTWLRPESDDALNEAMEAMDSPNSTSATTLEAEKKVVDHKKEVKEIDDGYEYNPESDDEFLEDDFHGGLERALEEEEEAPYIKDDDEIVEEFDERDDGYPPKYKGEIPVDVSEEAMQIGRETLQKMVALITDDATVTAQSDEDRLLLKVEGGNSGVLIGRRGQTLEAMQYLTDKIINRYSESRVRLKVDIEGYMETRKANLKTLAYKMADKAKKTGKPATINQMTAQDRRIIHLTLKDDTRVRTQSMGDGYYRRLVIFPKKSTFKRKKNFRK